MTVRILGICPRQSTHRGLTERQIVGIGAAILLIAIGAILAFAVHVDLAGVDITVVGWILMIVGVVGLVLTLTIWAPWRRRRVSDGVVEERRMYRDEPPPP